MFLQSILKTSMLFNFQIHFINHLLYLQNINGSQDTCSSYTKNDESITHDKDRSEDKNYFEKVENKRFMNYLWKCTNCKGKEESHEIYLLKTYKFFCRPCLNIYKENKSDEKIETFLSVRYDNEKEIIVISSFHFTPSKLEKMYHDVLKKPSYEYEHKFLLPTLTPSFYKKSFFYKEYSVCVSTDKEWQSGLRIFMQHQIEQLKVSNPKELINTAATIYSIKEIGLEKITGIFTYDEVFATNINVALQFFKIIFDKQFFDTLNVQDKTKLENESELIREFIKIMIGLHQDEDYILIYDFLIIWTLWKANQSKNALDHDDSSHSEKKGSEKIESLSNKLIEAILKKNFDIFGFIEEFLDLLQKSCLGAYVKNKLNITTLIVEENIMGQETIEKFLIIDFKLKPSYSDSKNLEINRSIFIQETSNTTNQKQKCLLQDVPNLTDIHLNTNKTESKKSQWEPLEYLFVRPSSISTEHSNTDRLPAKISISRKNELFFYEKEGSAMKVNGRGCRYYIFKRKDIVIDDKKVEFNRIDKESDTEELVLYKKVN